MCKNCKSSDLGIARQAELDAAIEACKELNINPAINGFLVRHAYQGSIPRRERGVLQHTAEEVQAITRYNAAMTAMKKLHEDYVWEQGRQGALLNRWHTHIGHLDYVAYSDVPRWLHLTGEQWETIKPTLDSLIASGQIEGLDGNEQYEASDRRYRLPERKG